MHVLTLESEADYKAARKQKQICNSKLNSMLLDTTPRSSLSYFKSKVDLSLTTGHLQIGIILSALVTGLSRLLVSAVSACTG